MRTNKDFIKVCWEIRKEMTNTVRTYPKDYGDLSDIGNEIGVIIAKYFNEDDNGFDKESFLAGLNHGISLTDGTHG